MVAKVENEKVMTAAIATIMGIKSFSLVANHTTLYLVV